MYAWYGVVQSTEDPADGTGRARMNQGGSYGTSVVACRPVTGGEFEAARSVNSPVKPAIGEIDGREEEIGRKVEEQGIGQERHGIGRGTSEHTKADPSGIEAIRAKINTTSSTEDAIQDRNLCRPRYHLDRRDLRSFRGYCRGMTPGRVT